MARAPSIALIAGLGLLVPRLAASDDGAIEAVGGAVRAMRNDTSVEMIAEFVHATVNQRQVDVECVFWLANRGKPTKVTIGFPCASGGTEVTEATPFKDFHSYVDGRSVPVRVLPDSMKQIHDEFGSWWVKRVDFAAGEVRCIRNTYRAEVGGSSDGSYWLDYILETGASWRGTIGTADIVITVVGTSADSIVADPQPTSRSGSEVCWHFTNFEPAEFARVSARWYPKNRRW